MVDSAIMYEAIGLASRLLKHDDRQQIENKYINHIPLSALEGQALREAVIKLKNSSYISLNRQDNNDIHQNRDSKPANLLITVNEMLEMAVKEKYQQNMVPRYEEENEYDEEQDDWEL